MMIELIDENIKRIKSLLSTLNEKLKQMEEVEKAKEQTKQDTQQKPAETKSAAEHEREMNFLLSYAKELEEKRKKMDSKTFDDVIKENLKNAKKHLKK